MNNQIERTNCANLKGRPEQNYGKLTYQELQVVHSLLVVQHETLNDLLHQEKPQGTPDEISNWKSEVETLSVILQKVDSELNDTIENLVWEYLNEIGVFDPCVASYKKHPNGQTYCASDCELCTKGTWIKDPTHEVLMDLLTWLDTLPDTDGGPDKYHLDLTRQDPLLEKLVREYFEESLHCTPEYTYCKEEQLEHISKDFLLFLQGMIPNRYYPKE